MPLILALPMVQTPIKSISLEDVIVYPAGQQALFFDRAEQAISVPDFAQNWQLTVGKLLGWLQI
jgi:hypothetical protein